MRGLKHILAAALLALGLAAPAAAQNVEIEYWQYTFETRVQRHGRADPAIPGRQPDHQGQARRTSPMPTTAPRSSAAMAAGPGPGRGAALLRLARRFHRRASCCSRCRRTRSRPRRSTRNSSRSVQAMKRDGEYYGLPTAVRSLALFYNKRLFEEAGLDPEQAAEDARRVCSRRRKKMTKRDGARQHHRRSASALDMARPGPSLVARGAGAPVRRHALFRRRQEGDLQQPRPASRRWSCYTDLLTKAIGRPARLHGRAARRRSAPARPAMIVDGTFRIGAFERTRRPSSGASPSCRPHDGIKSNYALLLGQRHRRQGHRREAEGRRRSSWPSSPPTTR